MRAWLKKKDDSHEGETSEHVIGQKRALHQIVARTFSSNFRKFSFVLYYVFWNVDGMQNGYFEKVSIAYDNYIDREMII